jgi:serine/threonine-protein kinase
MSQEKGKILCVDDEPSIVRSLQWLLHKDFDVVTANSGAEALELLAQHEFDVAISDQRMPLMSGVELLREIRHRSPRTMRILLTGYSDMQAIVGSVNESEVFRFINKPWNIGELSQVVAQAVAIARTPFVPDNADVTADLPFVANDACILVIDDDPAMGRAVSDVVGSAAKVSYTPNLADAVDILNREAVSVIVSETRVGSIDATRLVRLMKRRHPEIVTVMLTAESDADTVTTLINQGQIYRFVPKPVRAGYLKLVLNSALHKYSSLALDPALASRHAVDPPTPGAAESLMTDIHRAAAHAERHDPAARGGFMSLFTAGFRRLFGT